MAFLLLTRAVECTSNNALATRNEKRSSNVLVCLSTTKSYRSKKVHINTASIKNVETTQKIESLRQQRSRLNDLCSAAEVLLLTFFFFSTFTARAELDGNRPRTHNPRTLIQIKNPERNHDPSTSLSSSRQQPQTSSLSFDALASRFGLARRPFIGLASLVLVASTCLLLLFGASSSSSNAPQISALSPKLTRRSSWSTLHSSTSTSSSAAASTVDWARVFNKIG